MTESGRRRALDELTVWLLQQPTGRIFNRAGLPSFALLVPGARAYAIGDAAEIGHIASLLGAFGAGDTSRAAALMGSPPASAS